MKCAIMPMDTYLDIYNAIKAKTNLSGAQVDVDNLLPAIKSIPLLEEKQKLIDSDGIYTVEITPRKGYAFSKVMVDVLIENKLNSILNRTLSWVSEKDLEGVTEIPAYFFSGCPLWEVYFSDSVEIIRYGAFAGTYLEEVHFSSDSNLTRIEHSAFAECQYLYSIDIPEGVSFIGDEAFRKCYNLRHISLPSTIETLGSLLFGGIENLLSITCRATTPPYFGYEEDMFVWDDNGSFSGSFSGVIYVPSASVEAYKIAPVWRLYADQIEPIPEEETETGGETL